MPWSIRNKLIACLSALILNLLIFGLLAWLYIARLGDNLDAIAGWKMPAANLAIDVHEFAYGASAERLNGWVSESPDIHQQVQTALDKIDADLVKIDAIGRKFADSILLLQAATVRNQLADFRDLYNQGLTSSQGNRQALQTMTDSGSALLAEVEALAAQQEINRSGLPSSLIAHASPSPTSQVRLLVNRIRSMLQTSILRDKEARLESNRQPVRMQSELPQLMSLYDALAAITPAASVQTHIANLRKHSQTYVAAATQWLDGDQQRQQTASRLTHIAAGLRQSAGLIEQDVWNSSEAIARKTVALIDQANTLIISCLCFGLALGIGMAITVPDSIARSIDALSAFARTFGQGNLTARPRIQPNDEIGQMACDFDLAADSIHQIVGKVSAHSQTLQQYSRLLLRTVEDHTHGAQTQREYIEQMASAMSQMASSVQEVAQSAARAAYAASDTDQQARAGSLVAQQTVAAINHLANEINTASLTIGELERHVCEISGILNVIRNFSEQTNLLALNAAIEAARAGEHGLGFAMVANQVRTLASRTQSSTSQIHDMIERLRLGAKRAVAIINISQNLAEQSVDKARASGNALRAITDSVITINSLNAQIATSAEQQSAVTGQVNDTVIKINQLSETSMTSAQASLQSGIQLSRVANDLQEAVSQFKV